MKKKTVLVKARKLRALTNKLELAVGAFPEKAFHKAAFPGPDVEIGPNASRTIADDLLDYILDTHKAIRRLEVAVGRLFEERAEEEDEYERARQADAYLADITKQRAAKKRVGKKTTKKKRAVKKRAVKKKPAAKKARATRKAKRK